MVQLRVLEFLDDEAGTTLVEYGMLVMLVALLCIAAIKLLGTKVSSSYQQADALLP